MERGRTFVPTRITERIGEAIGLIGPEFSIPEIRAVHPDLSWNHIWKILLNKIDQEVIERIARGRYRMLEDRFVRMVPTAVVSTALWNVLWEHRRHTLAREEIILQCEAGTGRSNLAAAVNENLRIWCRKRAVVHTGTIAHSFFRLAKGVRHRPVTSMRGV